MFKTVYPYLNTGLEVWLLLWNIAYLFDKKPTYRPWLSWIGVDVRRLGIEDYVGAFLTPRAYIQLLFYIESGKSSGTESNFFGQDAQFIVASSCPSSKIAPFAIGFASVAVAHRNIFHKVFRMVVLTRITCPLVDFLTSGSGNTSPKYSTSSSERNSI